MMLDKFIFILYSSLFLIAPLLMSPFTSELFEFNKLIYIYLVTICVAFCWILKMLLSRKIIIKKTVFDIPILLFLGSQVLATLFSIDSHTSIFGYYGRFNGGLLSIIAYIILYYGFVANLTAGRQAIEKLLKVSVLASIIVIFWGLTGKLGFDLSCLLFVGQVGNSCWTDQFRPAERMFSTLGQPNWLGAYLAVNFFIALYFYLKKDANKSVLIYLLLNFIAVLFTRSRSALFAVIFGLVAICIYFIQQKLLTSFTKKRLKLLFLALIVAILLFKTGIEKIDKYLTISRKSKVESLKSNIQNSNKSKSESGITESGDIRKIVWKGAWDLGMKYPLFGTGVETFAYSYYFTRPQAHNLTSEWDYLYNKAHNEYLNYLATTGFVGVMAYLSLIIWVLIYGWRNIKNKILNIKNTNKNSKSSESNITIEQYNNSLLVFCLLISYLTILITNFFGFSTTTINLFFYLIPAFMVTLHQNLALNTQHLTLNNITSRQRISFFLVLSVTCLVLFGLIKYYLADVNYAKGDSFSKVGDYQKAVQYLNIANNFKYEHVYQDKLSYVLANIAFAAAYQKEKATTKNLIKAADDLNKKSLLASPKNVLYWKTRAKNYYLFYQISLSSADLDQALISLDKARSLSPTDPKIPYSLAIFLSLLEDNEKDATKKAEYQAKAMSEINKSIELKPNYRDAYFLKAQLLKKAGNIDEAKKLLEFILKDLNPSDAEVKKEIETLR